MNLCRLSNAEVHKNNGFDRLFLQIVKEEPSLRVESRVLQRRIFCFFGFPHPCGVISGKGYTLPMTVMLFTLPMSIVPLQDEVSVVMPSSNGWK